ncbi:hypothetical protein LY632_05025 [Erythrobacter sp. SDW2]|uniref:sigma factor-like helix-turn-helix DNA-binding protein n=1 Tax=Erythrobacter sp. SDW2 TaxID=2907154 RepID=UPI001F43EDA9|nr:sigma factor-like helix-turn-helix DNA-binding protein [Erythrobacter sp. SDW2]UIP07764.1 hypothetical protein LY632_05025 [Erythrobacter sp. SDW2]
MAVALGLFKSAYRCIGDEIEAILSVVLEGRNRELASKYWGFSGEKPRTLESVGQEYAMTRERVRQIVQRAEDLLRQLWLPTANLRMVLTRLSKRAPLPIRDAEGLLAERTGGSSLSIESILRAAEIFEVSTDVILIREGSDVFVDQRGRIPSVHEVVIDFRKATSTSGCINVDRMSLRLTGGLDVSRAIQSILGGLEEAIWLDSAQTWACSLLPERSRLDNIVNKVLSVSETIHISELRQAILRYYRVSFVPPQPVLASFVETISGHCVRDGMVHRGSRFVPTNLGDVESAFVACFHELGSPLRREVIEDFCIDRYSINANTFYVYLSYSPIVQKIGTGIYGLVGAHVPVGTVEQFEAEKKAEVRTEHGWDKAGRLWFATRLSRMSIRMGIFYLPSFVLNLTVGEWFAKLSDGTTSGILEITERGMTGLAPILTLAGAESSDVLCVRFDFNAKVAEIEIGSDELFDMSFVPVSDGGNFQLEAEEEQMEKSEDRDC